MQVGVFGPTSDDLPEPGEVLAIEERKLTEADATFTFVVDSKPERAGIDPYNLLIDRNPRDNTQRVEEVAGE